MKSSKPKLILKALSHVEQMVSSKLKYSDVEVVKLNDKISVEVYDHKTFKEIRKNDGILSLEGLKEPYIFNENLCGNSGSSIFFTGNFKYAIKTIRNSEKKCMLSIIHKYKKFLINNPGSFLCRIYGCYSIRNGENVDNYIIMNNILQDTSLGEIYDLKGTNVSRKSDGKSILKDVDWENKNKVINLRGSKARIVLQIEKDVNFLKHLEIMDYSLMLNIPSSKVENNFFVHKTNEDNNGGSYILYKEHTKLIGNTCCFGIVDILTQWNSTKILEGLFGLMCCKSDISCVDPNTYAERFLDMIDKSFE